MKQYLLALSLMSLIACGGGSSGSGSSTPQIPSVTPLVVGTEVVDTSTDQDGYVNVTFPGSTGDLPMITGVIVDGAVADGWADLPNPNNTSYDINTDGVDLYMPIAGTYAITITIEDNGDSPVNQVFNVTIPGSNTFPLSGKVEDGPSGSESGVNTSVRLYWHPLSASKTQITSIQSNPGSNGSFAFTNLVGSADDFEIRVDGGTD